MEVSDEKGITGEKDSLTGVTLTGSSSEVAVDDDPGDPADRHLGLLNRASVPREISSKNLFLKPRAPLFRKNLREMDEMQ